VKLYAEGGAIDDSSTDADWQVYAVNNATATLVDQANRQLESEATITKKTYTAAS
jgi:hypothetical protein